MAKKDLLIGGCTNYNINQLKPWVLSAVEHMPKSHKVMVVGNASDETKQWLVDQGFEVFPMAQANIPVHVLRFVSIYEYLRLNYSKYRYVITTDVKDVIFQYNAFNWLDSHLGSCKLVAGSEGMLYKDEPWGNENLMQAYGPYIHNMYKDKQIYNVGTIGGESEYVKDMVFNIFTNATNRPIAICDQAVYNVLIQTQPFCDVTYFAQQCDGWACQAGTTVDPSKIEHFKPFLTESQPIWEQGVVKTGQDCYRMTKGNPFAIVHQYDRVPEWKKHIEEKYGVEDLITFRTN